MRMSTRWLVAGLACIVVLAILAVFKYAQIRAAIAYGESFPEPSESVSAAIAVPDVSTETFSTIGELIAPLHLVLRNELEGRIESLALEPGARVVKGDILVQQDVSEESARLEAARARAELTRLELERARRLVERKSVSEETLDRARADHDVARAEVMALEAVIAKKTLRAPFDAVIGLHDLDPGDYLQANSPLVTLVGLEDTTWVEFNVPVTRGRVAPGSEVTVTLPGTAGEILPATVIAGSATASASSRNVRLRARIDRRLSLPSNSVVEVGVALAAREIIRLPRMALLYDSRGSYVFVLEENPGGDGYRARRRAVEVAASDKDTIAVAAGLEGGERVAVDGAFKLAPGMLARARERTPAGEGEGE